ncbi:MAG TPA: hypothetical protein VJ895_02615 [Candidatus Nanoarchaeia archaeon]|nr:hypothetical protein [Candidatus Nanoarchaeia archaeon]
MSLFGKKEKKEAPSPPKLPELPSLPNFEESNGEEMHKLPSFPNNNFGEKFSQNTIKNAVTGGNMNEFEMSEPQENEAPLEKIKGFRKPKEIESGFPLQEKTTGYSKKRVDSAEPVFIRLDKFEESLKIFEETKEKIGEIEELLKETKELKDKEEDELSEWASEIQNTKEQIEQIDKNIFSKI